MVGRELQGWEGHIFLVDSFPSVIFPRLYNLKVLLVENNEILWIDVSLFAFLGTLTSLVQLRLQVGTSIVSGVV